MSHCRIPPILLLTLVGAGLPLEAATLKGIVRANELGGPPVPNVQVAVVAGANSTATDDNGRFTLEFPAKFPGEMVQLIVRKTGRVVVNDVQLRWPLPKDPDAEPLVLLLCREEVREEMACRFYQLKSFEAIDAAYRNRLRELQENQQATAAELAKLRTERDQAKAAAEKAAEELARPSPGQSSELYQEAMRLFLAGKVSDAIKILDMDRLRRSAEEAKQRKSMAEKELADVVQAFLLRARLLTTQLQFGEAERSYEEAIATAPESFDAFFGYAAFQQELNRYAKASSAYRRCEDLARQSGNPVKLVMTLNNLGILHRAQNRMEEARKAHEEALKICRQLAEKNPETYLPYVADTLNNLGVLHCDQNRMEDARKAYEEALKIRRQLAEQNPETYLPDVTTTLNNLGNLHRDQNRMEDARQAYEEALKIRRQLAEKNPDAYLPYVARTLNNLGTLHHVQDRMQEARRTYEEALKIHRQLAEKNPETYLPYVAMTLDNLGVLHSVQNRMEDARKAFDEALHIYESFAKGNPERYGADVNRVKELIKNLKPAIPPAQ